MKKELLKSIVSVAIGIVAVVAALFAAWAFLWIGYALGFQM